MPQTSKKVKCFQNASFTMEELHLLVRLLMSHALNTIVHKIMVPNMTIEEPGVLHEEVTIQLVIIYMP